MSLPKINHTQISNAFIENYMSKVSGSATKIFLAISRKTIGWHKETDIVSQSQITKLTGITSHNTIQKAIKELVDLDLIMVSVTGEGKATKTSFEINYDALIESNMSKNDILEKKNMSKSDTKTKLNMSENDIKAGNNMSINDTTKEININKKYKESAKVFLNKLGIEYQEGSPPLKNLYKAFEYLENDKAYCTITGNRIVLSGSEFLEPIKPYFTRFIIESGLKYVVETM